MLGWDVEIYLSTWNLMNLPTIVLLTLEGQSLKACVRQAIHETKPPCTPLPTIGAELQEWQKALKICTGFVHRFCTVVPSRFCSDASILTLFHDSCHARPNCQEVWHSLHMFLFTALAVMAFVLGLIAGWKQFCTAQPIRHFQSIECMTHLDWLRLFKSFFYSKSASQPQFHLQDHARILNIAIIREFQIAFFLGFVTLCAKPNIIFRSQPYSNGLQCVTKW